MIKQLSLSLIICSIGQLSQAHDGHSHDAPWQACATAKKGEACNYENGAKDLFIGTCRQFQGTLMCVRNKPIVRANRPDQTVDDSD